MIEQSKAMKDISTSSVNVAAQIKLITAANSKHSTSAESILSSLAEMGVVYGQTARDAGALSQDNREVTVARLETAPNLAKKRAPTVNPKPRNGTKGK
jgi:hypothetical protein